MDNELLHVEPPVAPSASVEELIAETLCIRDELKDARLVWETFEAEKKLRLEKIEMELMQLADSVGSDSLKCKFGIAFKQLKEYYRVGSWDLTIGWIIKTGNYQMLEKRIAKLATKEIHKATGEVPPGVEYSAEVEMVVRKSPTKE
jgi:hypothetical protein